ncbi:MAG TPA: hypothetical protein VEI97_12815, partial [bacterium]|nr:hypothetical protein [bacterium]
EAHDVGKELRHIFRFQFFSPNVARSPTKRAFSSAKADNASRIQFQASSYLPATFQPATSHLPAIQVFAGNASK